MYDKLLTDPQMVFLDEGTAQASFIYVKNLAHWITLAARVRAPTTKQQRGRPRL